MPPVTPDAGGRRYTWDDYTSWPEGTRIELVDGRAYAMSPGPSARHQWVAGLIFGEFLRCLAGKKCTPFMSGTDVHLSDHDVVEPDLLVVCDPRQIKESHIEGAPALVVEVLSPSTALHDRKRKMALYAARGVQEYWIVTPYPPMVEVYSLDGGRLFSSATYGEEETLYSDAIPAISIDLSKVFTFPVPPDDRIQLVEESIVPYGANATHDANT